ncbi:MAG: DUF1043 family protein [Deltaproteobacteria bacterium]|nr:DUF1043 family protein [Deltaproteobacteria bacterium]
MDSLLSPWLIVVSSIVVGALLGIVFERTRGTAAKRAARFEAELVEARSELMRYRDQTKHHFGKSAELLGKMATDYREFLDHFVAGATELCGPNMKELDASGLDQRLLGTSAPASGAAASVAAPAETAMAAPVASGIPASPAAPLTSGTTVPIRTVTPAPIASAHGAPTTPLAAPRTPHPSAFGAVATDPFAEDVAK